jgi:hypothetical protein
MKYKNWDDFKVYVSGISRIMSHPKGVKDLSKPEVKKRDYLLGQTDLTDEEVGLLAFLNKKRETYLHPPLAVTAQSYLVERYSADKYNIRRASAGGLQRATITKGVALENEGIDLLKFLDKIEYQQPEKPLSNDYLIGQCDILCLDAKKIVDVKTSWNAANFMQKRRENRISSQQWCQIQGYMELYDIDFGQVSYVLVNTPPHLIDQEKANLFRRYTFGELIREDYEEQMEKFDSLYDYGKIPMHKRVIRFDVHRCREFMPMVKRKVELCRVFLNEFERTFLSGKNILTLPETYINIASSNEDSSESDPLKSYTSD